MKLDVTLTVEEVKDAVVAVLEKDGFPVKQGTADMNISQGRNGNPTTVTISIDTNGVPGTPKAAPELETKVETKQRKPRGSRKEEEPAKKEVVTQTGAEIMEDTPKVEAKVETLDEAAVAETEEANPPFEEEALEVEEESNVKMESAPSTSLFD